MSRHFNLISDVGFSISDLFKDKYPKSKIRNPNLKYHPQSHTDNDQYRCFYFGKMQHQEGAGH